MPNAPFCNTFDLHYLENLFFWFSFKQPLKSAFTVNTTKAQKSLYIRANSPGPSSPVKFSWDLPFKEPFATLPIFSVD